MHALRNSQPPKATKTLSLVYSVCMQDLAVSMYATEGTRALLLTDRFDHRHIHACS